MEKLITIYNTEYANFISHHEAETDFSGMIDG